MPVSGGTTLKDSKASWPQRRNWYRSSLRSNSFSALTLNAWALPKASTWTEWSMTSSAGTSGSIFDGSPPSSLIASRIAARSTTAGTPVKSWSTTRAGVKAISSDGSALASHVASASICSFVTEPLPSVRSRFSSSTLRLYGRRATSYFSWSASRRKISTSRPPTDSVSWAPKLLG
ncbi:unannotated protein [freshwater metagenome]|uniref:Unannotated protein n=1 Tax=freshwater metagenome TaxID=449393 RepID=A0A6J7KEH2_9ZZZZ